MTNTTTPAATETATKIVTVHAAIKAEGLTLQAVDAAALHLGDEHVAAAADWYARAAVGYLVPSDAYPEGDVAKARSRAKISALYRTVAA